MIGALHGCYCRIFDAAFADGVKSVLPILPNDLRNPDEGPLCLPARGRRSTPHGLAIDLIKIGRLLGPAARDTNLTDAAQCFRDAKMA